VHRLYVWIGENRDSEITFKNRAYIRTHLLQRAEQPLPTEQPGQLKKMKRANLIAASYGLARNRFPRRVSGHASVRDRPSFWSSLTDLNGMDPQAEKSPRLPVVKADRAAAASPVGGRLSASVVSLSFVFQFP
jgi:hypothetical protein